MMNGQEQVRRSTRSSRRRILDVDLNAVPPSHDSQTAQQGGAAMPQPIDLEALDDDVIISSPRAFAEAKNNSRRNNERCPVVVDVDSVVTDERLSHNKRKRGVPTNQTIINCDLYINLEGSSNSTSKSKQSAVVAPPPPPPPKEPVFTCAICMGPLIEETSTKCGHIFCKGCIKAALAAKSNCPTCRKKTTVKDLIRVYLPRSS